MNISLTPYANDEDSDDQVRVLAMTAGMQTDEEISEFLAREKRASWAYGVCGALLIGAAWLMYDGTLSWRAIFSFALGYFFLGKMLRGWIDRTRFFVPLSSWTKLCQQVEEMALLSPAVRRYIRGTHAFRPLRVFDIAKLNVLYDEDPDALVPSDEGEGAYERLVATCGGKTPSYADKEMVVGCALRDKVEGLRI